MRVESMPLDTRGRAWTLLAMAACLLPLLLQLPMRASLGTTIVGLAMVTLAWRWQVPTWLRLLLVVSLVGIVLSAMDFRLGRDTGCALLAAMLAIKPLELRTLRDARSLLGFALFAPFATFLLDQGPLSLVLAFTAAFAVLMALLRLSERESGDAAPRSASGRAAATLRLVAMGIPLALAAFWLFPRMATPLWGVPERAIAKPGLSDTMSPGEWIDLMGDDTPALRVTFFGATPPTSQMYWRGPVLMDFDGRDWTQSRRLGHLPPPPVERSRTTWDYEVEIEPNEQTILVALEMPHAVPQGARMSWDLAMRTDRPLTSLTRWRMRASPPLHFETTLTPMVRADALRLPDGFNPRTVALARQWRREAGDGNDAAIVERTMQMIRGEFGYTLLTPLPGRHTADEFLFEWKRGFCEHFSSAYVVLMRAAGIPARVDTGYVGGYRNPVGGYWIVSNMDAHAWAEVWLEGRGWVRVDPTAAVAPERIYDTLDDRMTRGFGGLPMLGRAVDIGDWLRRGWNDLVLGFDAARQRELLRPLGGERIGERGLIALFATAATLALAWMLWLGARGARERDPVLRAWHRLGKRYARRGRGRAAHEPPLQWVGRISASLPPATSAALSALSHRFVEWRYARDHGPAATARELARDLRRHRPGRIDPQEPSP